MITVTSPPNGPKAADSWTGPHTVGLLLLVAAIVAVCVFGSSFDLLRQYTLLATWGLTMLLLAGFVSVAGHGLTGLWRGALIDNRNKISLSRFQLALWTVVIISAFLVAGVANLTKSPNKDPLGIAIPAQIWAVLGISTTSLVGSPLILAVKGQPKDLTPDLTPDLTRHNPVALPQAPTEKQQGVLLVNKSAYDSSFKDLFEGEEVGNNGHLDLGKIQMFYFTLIVLAVYSAALGALLVSGPRIGAFPQLDASVVALLGISHAGYLTNKAIPHTQTRS